MKDQQFTLLADNNVIEKPIIDDRSYRFIKLNSNDLHVLLINDPTADKSAASLDVNVGSFADKQYQIPGLAHFCEHLLFMGTEKYPQENEYSSYLSKHSGHSNAYTSSEHTNYYFQLSSDYLEGALDRFAQFFICPLFSNSCKDREINAVDSENKKNLQNDDWRLHQLDKSNSNPNHPYNGFSTGNYQTLHVEPIAKGINVRDVLIEFHKSHYSSNLMNLVILGKEDLDTLTSWAIDKFSAVPNKNLPRPQYNGSIILQPEHLGKLTKAKPIMDNHQVELMFMVPDDLENQWATKPQGYFSHLIGHESEGSILHFLKSKGWATELSSGNMKICEGNSFFIIEIHLTPSGLENWKQIIQISFDYLNLITKEHEPQQWIWQEMQEMSQINFKFKQKSDTSSTVSRLSSTLYKYPAIIPPEYILSSSIYREFDPKLIKQFGQYLNPDNFRITLVSQSLTGLTKREKWYGTEYEFEPIPQDLMKAIRSPTKNPKLQFPIPNDFIPTDFEVLKKKSPTPQLAPYVIENNNKMNVWYKQDDRFEVPKGTIEVAFHIPSSNTDIYSSTCAALMTELLNDELNQITYYASLVGLKVHIITWRDGINFKVTGYNDKLAVLLEKVLQKFVNFKPDKERFDAIKFKLRKEFKNFGYSVPYAQIGTYFLTLVNEKTYLYDDKVKILDDISFEDIYKFSTEDIWKSGIFAEVLIHGNFDIVKANDIKATIQNAIQKIKPIANEYNQIEEVFRMQNFILQSGEVIRYELPLQDDKNINSCIEYYIQISPDSEDPRLRVFTDLLATIIREPCFNQLRTKEQLGYVVFSGVRLGRTSLGFRILIQSERTNDYLEYRIDEFLLHFGKYVNEKLTQEDFNKFKQALKDFKLAKLKHLNEETSRLWNTITDGYYDFESRLKHVSILENITKQEFIDYFNDYIRAGNTKTGKLLVYLNSQNANEISLEKRVQSAVVNYVYKHDYEIDHDIIESIVKEQIQEKIDYNLVTKKLIAEIRKVNPDAELDEASIESVIQIMVEKPVPEDYPTGQLITQINEFRNDRLTGGIPKPVNPLSKFYYDQSHL
ncbi:STE23 [[Candida] subhashii]|uniref:STE23 n=1 Tax=[Candida] subhashii TaxID=561895 RepID=A0A8J5Q2A5_9ASCO|nr:STE23 [[Candida] subhashii]KAG7660809.1 STE23 [[Candida] subhashii]